MSEPTKIHTRAEVLAAIDEEFMFPRNNLVVRNTDQALRELVEELRASLKALLADRFSDAARQRARRVLRKTGECTKVVTNV